MGAQSPVSRWRKYWNDPEYREKILEKQKRYYRMRQLKRYKYKRNGDSLQLYERGVYCGSLPLKLLCQKARERNLNKHGMGKSTSLTNTEVPEFDWLKHGNRV